MEAAVGGLSMTLYELQGFPGLSWMGRGSLWEKVEEQIFGIAVEVGSLLQAPVARQPGINNMCSTFHTWIDFQHIKNRVGKSNLNSTDAYFATKN